MGKMKKKYESGSATAFIPRNQAIKKLQLTIADFRRLCILKGVFPVEPKNKKKVNKGSTANRTFYYAKDINYLAHEPIINKFREFKTYVKRLKRARGRRDVKALGRLRAHKPAYNLDHIVKERYPTFIDAIHDLDDCLSLVFLFSVLPKSKRIYVERVHFCKRLALEFMHYIIASKSLRKCFISIKGYYFQADIKGHKVTWIMPHKLAYQVPDDVDFRIMSTFVEFYSIMLGFVNYKAYSELGLIYPPKLSLNSNEPKAEMDDDFQDEYLASLNCDFLKINENSDDPGDVFPDEAADDNPNLLEKAKLEEENLKKLKNLFKGLKFFLNREIPREQFVLAIKAFSGEVSWDKTLALGATYQEDDETITHHVVDRPVINKTHLNRVYIQPQWIFDCINENMLLPVDDYLPGAVLPPHLSPFVDAIESGYIPPEKQRLIDMKMGKVDTTDALKKDNNVNNKPQQETVVENGKKNGSAVKKVETVDLKKQPAKADNTKKQQQQQQKVKDTEESTDEDEEDVNDMKVDLDTPDEDESDSEADEPIDDDDEETSKKDQNKKPIIMVEKSKPKEENLNLLLNRQVNEEKKLAEMMMSKRDKHLYDKIIKSKKKQKQEIDKLKEKRLNYENNIKSSKKLK